MINAQQLQQLGIGPEWVDPLNETFNRWGINSVDEQAAFIGQYSHECNHFKVLEENLNYSAATLQKLFGHKFGPGEIDLYAHKPEKIANRIYSNRMGNRSEASGDGWRFRGSAICQLTGHDNFYHAGKDLGVDLVMNPDLARTPKYAAPIGGWFWKTHGCNQFADAEDWQGLTKRINGGLIGLDQRIALTKNALAVLK
jgi:putative chitinase